MACTKSRSGFTLECDDGCTAKRNQIRLASEVAEQQRNEAEAERNRAELLEFEKKFSKRKPRERKQPVEQKPRNSHVAVYIGIAAAGVALLAALVYSFTTTI